MNRQKLGAILGLSLVTSLAAAAGWDSSTPKQAAADDYAAGKAALSTRDWNTAIEKFDAALNKDRDNADIYNYLGYAYRNAGQLDAAFKNYNEALRLNPKHLGAHAYMGVAYLVRKEPAKAEEQLAILKSLCGMQCEEYEDLESALGDYRKKNP